MTDTTRPEPQQESTVDLERVDPAEAPEIAERLADELNDRLEATADEEEER